MAGKPGRGSPNKGKGKAFAFLQSLVGHVGDECVSWPFGRMHKGYGQLGHLGKSHKAHRMLCEMVYGPPPTDKHQATHSCGNGHLGCVNPNHLEWKTSSTATRMERCRSTGTRGGF